MASNRFKLRPAREDDQALITMLVRESGINPFGLDWRRFVVAVDENDRLIGCGQVKIHGDRSREMASLAVKKPWRQQGVARAIVQDLQQGYGPPLWLTCIDRLVPFYQRFGFVEISDLDLMPSYYRYARRFFNLYLRLRRSKLRLAVMLWRQ